MHQLTHKLQQFYNQNAQHFSQTRKKHRPEFDYIMNIINTYPWKKMTIRELGCGDGRFYTYLQKNCNKEINYTWIDISDELLKIAKKTISTKDKKSKLWPLNSKLFPKATFIHADMIEHIQQGKQESVNIIVSIAAFQHIPTLSQRRLVLKNIYRLLTYEWKYIMTNRTASQRFIQKYWKPILLSRMKTIVTIGQHTWRDLSIPWENKGKKWWRYYHLYGEKECTNLAQESWFIVEENRYMTTDGQITDNQKNARNMITVLKKSTF